MNIVIFRRTQFFLTCALMRALKTFLPLILCVGLFSNPKAGSEFVGN